MAVAIEDQRSTVANDLAGGPRVPRQCTQRVPHQCMCRDAVGFICDVCGSAVCRGHVRLASMPRSIDRDAGRGMRGPDAPPLDLCVMCARFEEYHGIAIEELTPDQLQRWRASEHALGYVSGDRD